MIYFALTCPAPQVREATDTERSFAISRAQGRLLQPPGAPSLSERRCAARSQAAGSPGGSFSAGHRDDRDGDCITPRSRGTDVRGLGAVCRRTQSRGCLAGRLSGGPPLREGDPKPVSRYDPLRQFLLATPSGQREVILSYRQLEALIGGELPHSAHAHRAWWANQVDTRNRPHASAWMGAGFRVEEVRQTGAERWVRFRRTEGTA